MSAMYESFFGFNESPFSVTPDPRFMYFSKRHREAYALLMYGLEQKKGFIEITGEIGAGKTTLCRRLLGELGQKVRSAVILNPRLSEGQLIEAIVDDFGVQPKNRNRKGYFNALNHFLLEAACQGLLAVIVIDEAQNLSLKTLEQIRLLSNLETDREKLLQILLVGQPELREILRDPRLLQLRQRIGIRYHLPALNRMETEEYILHRIHVAGGDGSEVCSLPAYDLIYEISRGIPRVINLLCDRALLAAYAMERRGVDETVVQKAFEEIEGIVPAGAGV